MRISDWSSDVALPICFRDGQVLARGRAMQLRAERGNHFTLGAPEFVDLAEMDVVLMRQDPPFDMAYITATHILQHIHPQTLLVKIGRASCRERVCQYV